MPRPTRVRTKKTKREKVKEIEVESNLTEEEKSLLAAQEKASTGFTAPLVRTSPPESPLPSPKAFEKNKGNNKGKTFSGSTPTTHRKDTEITEKSHRDKNITETEVHQGQNGRSDKNTTETKTHQGQNCHSDKNATETGAHQGQNCHSDKNITETGIHQGQSSHSDKNITETGIHQGQSSHSDKNITETKTHQGQSSHSNKDATETKTHQGQGNHSDKNITATKNHQGQEGPKAEKSTVRDDLEMSQYFYRWLAKKDFPRSSRLILESLFLNVTNYGQKKGVKSKSCLARELKMDRASLNRAVKRTLEIASENVIVKEVPILKKNGEPGKSTTTEWEFRIQQ